MIWTCTVYSELTISIPLTCRILVCVFKALPDKSSEEAFLLKGFYFFSSLDQFLSPTQLDKKVITKIALGEGEPDKSVIKHCCDKTKHYIETVTEKMVNGSLMNVTEKELSCKKHCK